MQNFHAKKNFFQATIRKSFPLSLKVF